MTGKPFSYQANCFFCVLMYAPHSSISTDDVNTRNTEDIRQITSAAKFAFFRQIWLFLRSTAEKVEELQEAWVLDFVEIKLAFSFFYDLPYKIYNNYWFSYHHTANYHLYFDNAHTNRIWQSNEFEVRFRKDATNEQRV